MPINYNKEEDSWELVNPTPEEKASLIEVAAEHLMEYYGQQIAHAFMAYAEKNGMPIDLEDVPVESLGKAN